MRLRILECSYFTLVSFNEGDLVNLSDLGSYLINTQVTKHVSYDQMTLVARKCHGLNSPFVLVGRTRSPNNAHILSSFKLRVHIQNSLEVSIDRLTRFH